jgi:hypothetical protein
VSCLICGFDNIPMWVLHFEVKGPPKFEPTIINFGMRFHVGITYWLISITCNTYLVFQFIIVLDVDIAYQEFMIGR